MDAITSYVNHLFSSLPQTGEVTRARNELLGMSGDRYDALLAEGVSEQEPVGRVIAQLGSLDELADDLGIRSEVAEASEGAPAEAAAAAAEHLRLNRRAATMFGASLFTLAAAQVLHAFGIWVTQPYPFTVSYPPTPEELAAAAALVPYRIAAIVVALVAVAIGVRAVVILRRSALASRRLRALNANALADYLVERDRERWPLLAGLVLGVLLTLVGAQATLASITFPLGGPYLILWFAFLGPFVLALGIALIIRLLLRWNALGRITAERHRHQGYVR